MRIANTPKPLLRHCQRYSLFYPLPEYDDQKTIVKTECGFGIIFQRVGFSESGVDLELDWGAVGRGDVDESGVCDRVFGGIVVVYDED